MRTALPGATTSESASMCRRAFASTLVLDAHLTALRVACNDHSRTSNLTKHKMV